MACRLPYSVEDMQVYVQNQCNNDDEARKNAIISVIELFDQAKAEKEQMRQNYKSCNDITPERKAVIDKFLKDQARKDREVADKLWRCVQKITNNVSTKINWSYRENKNDGVGASTSTTNFELPGEPLLDEEDLARFEGFAGSRTPSYDSACGEHSD